MASTLHPRSLDDDAPFGKPSEATVTAEPCGFSVALPDIPIPPVSIKLPSLTDPLPRAPVPKLSFRLTCSPDKPIDITAGVEFGGGRTPRYFPDPDDRGET